MDAVTIQNVATLSREGEGEQPIACAGIAPYLIAIWLQEPARDKTSCRWHRPCHNSILHHISNINPHGRKAQTGGDLRYSH